MCWSSSNAAGIVRVRQCVEFILDALGLGFFLGLGAFTCLVGPPSNERIETCGEVIDRVGQHRRLNSACLVLQRRDLIGSEPGLLKLFESVVRVLLIAGYIPSLRTLNR